MEILPKYKSIENISPDDPFEHCCLGREGLGKQLTTLIETIERDSFVLSLNGPWGSGKTTFLRMWHALLLSKEHPALYYNAWETDFVEDPLAAFIGELARGVGRDSTGIPAASGSHVDALKNAGAILLRNVGPVAVQLATQGLINKEMVGRGVEALKDLAKPIGEAAGEIARQRLGAFGEEKDAVEEFRKHLGRIVEAAKSDGKNLPMVIFVDELDRCRPTFAISLLERIKHVFEVPDLVFVLGIDREQLAHSVKAVYGESFDADGYLRRFSDLEVRLPQPAAGKFAQFLLERVKIGALNTVGAQSFGVVAKVFNLPLRVQERCFTEMAVLSATAGDKKIISQGVVAFLVGFRAAHPEAYELYRSGARTLENLLIDIWKEEGWSTDVISRDLQTDEEISRHWGALSSPRETWVQRHMEELDNPALHYGE